MIRSIRSIIVLALLAWTMLMATTGCALFQPKPEPQRPRTVEEWMAQPRVPIVATVSLAKLRDIKSRRLAVSIRFMNTKASRPTNRLVAAATWLAAWASALVLLAAGCSSGPGKPIPRPSHEAAAANDFPTAIQAGIPAPDAEKMRRRQSLGPLDMPWRWRQNLLLAIFPKLSIFAMTMESLVSG